MKTIIARWESTSGKHYCNLTEDNFGYGYSSGGAGGSFGDMTLKESLARVESIVDTFQPDKNKTKMRRVL